MTMILSGAAIKKHREEQNVTIAALAERLGVDKARIERIEEGTEFASPDLMDGIEEALGIRSATSFDAEELIEELERDVAEFGADRDCWLIYKPLHDCIRFTDYQPIVAEYPLDKSELDPDERAVMTTYGKALAWLRRQDSIF